MADTVFLDKQTTILADWLNAVNDLRYGAGSPIRGSALLEYTSSATGAVSRTAQSKIGEWLSVKDFGATGNGSTDDYAAIILAYSAAVASGKSLAFPPGTYVLGTNWVISTGGVRIFAIGLVILKFTNAGKALSIDAGASANIYDVHFGTADNPFLITGNASTTDAIYWRGTHHSSLYAKAWNCITAFRSEFAVLNDFGITASVNELFATSVLVPTYGIYCDHRSVGEDTAANNFHNPILEGIKTGAGEGIHLKYTLRNKVFGGTSEGNNVGLIADSTAVGDTVNGLYLEQISLNGFDISGQHITINDPYVGTGGTTPSAFWCVVRSGATDCLISGGDIPGITIQTGAVRTQCIGGSHTVAPFISDSGTDSLLINAAASLFANGAKFGAGTTYTLDYYDAGTFTATIVPASGSVTLNASYQTLGWVKIGRLVTITGVLLVSGVSSPTGVTYIAGLPFAPDSSNASGAGVAARADGLDATITAPIQGYMIPSFGRIYLDYIAAGVATGLGAKIKANTQFNLTATYRAAS